MTFKYHDSTADVLFFSWDMVLFFALIIVDYNHWITFAQQLIFIKIWFFGLTWLGLEIFVEVISPLPLTLICPKYVRAMNLTPVNLSNHSVFTKATGQSTSVFRNPSNIWDGQLVFLSCHKAWFYHVFSRSVSSSPNHGVLTLFVSMSHLCISWKLGV